MIADVYDVIVVGGGPAGSMAARYAAEGGASVLLLEKDREIGLPVRCAEAVGKKSFEKFIKPDPQWVAHQLGTICFVAPNGISFTINTDQIGYILNRRVFDQELARSAANAGAQIVTRAYVYGLENGSDRRQKVKVQFPHLSREIFAKIVIGADGVESRVGRWAGLRTNFALKDIETCYQYTLSGIKVETDYAYCYFGGFVAPGGYAWVFPKGGDLANVGLGMAANRTNERNAKNLLDRFVETHFPKASVLACVAGGVPAARPFKKIHASGVLLAGDAAAHSNPLTGGGITNAMAAGKLAGEIAANSIKQGDWSEKSLSRYTDEWEKRWGDEQRRFYRIKEVVHQLDDETLNKAAGILVNLPPEKRTLQGVFWTTLTRYPRILLDVARCFF